MIKLIEKKDCCGCYACLQSCPVKCIAMQEDNEGFLYPIIDKTICIDCGLCEKVCPVINQRSPQKPLKIYAAINKNQQIRNESSSGGIFTLLAEQIIEEGGVVFGARFNEKWEVIHDYTENKGGLNAFRGSKYSQSRIGETFQQTEKFLKEGRKVLFTGTPCQIAGLNKYLKIKYEKLLTMDLVCHGTPSPKVFGLYLDEIKYKTMPLSVISSINFRDKNTGWKKFSLSIRFTNPANEVKNSSILFSETLDKNIFLRGFLKDLYLRPSCHDCPSKSFKAGSDITIADYWGIAAYYPELDDDKGTSLLFVNTPAGNNCLKNMEGIVAETTYEQAVAGNPAIEKSVMKHKNREAFFLKINDGNLTQTIDRFTSSSFKEKTKEYFFNLLALASRLKKTVFSV